MSGLLSPSSRTTTAGVGASVLLVRASWTCRRLPRRCNTKERAMTPLRQKLIDDLDLRSRADTTILAYVSACARLARYHRRSPEHLDLDHVRAFLLHLQRDCMASPANVKLHVAALRFLYGTTLERPDLAAALPYPRVPRTPPASTWPCGPRCSARPGAHGTDWNRGPRCSPSWVVSTTGLATPSPPTSSSSWPGPPCVAHPPWANTYTTASPAATATRPGTPAGTGTLQAARPSPRPSRSPSASSACCRVLTSTWSSPCRA